MRTGVLDIDCAWLCGVVEACYDCGARDSSWLSKQC